MNTPIPASPDWRRRADERIAAHRQTDVAVELRDATGAPWPQGHRVRVRLVRHAFHFGTALAEPVLDRSPDDPRRRAYEAFLLRCFNTIVAENGMKWYTIEARAGVLNHGPGDAVVAFARRHGLSLRGHTLLWDREKFVQAWVRELAPEALRAAATAHLQATARRYAPDVFCWDVNNEMLDGGFFTDRLGTDFEAEPFRLAAAAAPGVPLFVNEFSILGHEAKTDRYLELIARLRAHGAPVGGIGVQEHAAERLLLRSQAADDPAEFAPERRHQERLAPEAMWHTLDRLAATGLPIHLTEVSAQTADEDRRADCLEMLLRLGFAHPKVEAILLWGFWSRAHWLGREAALLDDDGRLLPAGERVVHLLTKEWSTDLDVPVGPDGQIRWRGFRGTYTITPPGLPPATWDTESSTGPLVAPRPP